jgi:hypothetical protein
MGSIHMNPSRLSITTIVAYSLTPKPPAVSIKSSKNHHSEHSIIVAGIAIPKYYFHPFRASMLGIKIASAISAFLAA